jgi:hypothetical protein
MQPKTDRDQSSHEMVGLSELKKESRNSQRLEKKAY